MSTKNANPQGSLERLVRRGVLERTLAALEASVEDGKNYGLSKVEPEYLKAIAEARAELAKAPNTEITQPNEKE